MSDIEENKQIEEKIDFGNVNDEKLSGSEHIYQFFLNNLHHNLDITVAHVLIAVIFLSMGVYLGNKYFEYNEFKSHFSQLQKNIFDAQDKLILNQFNSQKQKRPKQNPQIYLKPNK